VTPAWPLITADWNFWPDGVTGEATFAAARRLGFEGIELGVYAARNNLDEPRQRAITRWRDTYHLTVPVVLYSLPPKRWPAGCLAHPDPKVRRLVTDETGGIASAARAIDATILGVWLGGDRRTVVDDYGRAWAWMVEGVRAMAAAAQSAGLRLALEYKPGEIIGNADAFLRLTDAVGADNLGLLLDTGHALYGREDLVAVVKMCAGRLIHVHLDDNYGDADRDLPVGDVHNFDAFFEALHDVGYRGLLSLDLYYGVAEDAIPADDACRRSKAYIERAIDRLRTR
jgi:sugar phosphate isomerase/epimerase